MRLLTALGVVLRASVIILHSPLTALAAVLPSASPTVPSLALPSASTVVLSSSLVPYDPFLQPNATAEHQAFLATKPHVKFHVMNSQIDLYFWGFGRAIPHYEFLRENIDATERTYRTVLDGHGDQPIVHGMWTHRMRFGDGMAVTSQVCDFDMHGRPMTFRDLWTVLRGVGLYVSEGQGRFEELHYEVDHEERGRLGFGSLKYERLGSVWISQA
ncbi:MAG: hypothetical protein LQ351_000656 [Letrouitia transgressa]|nr:MAG: hypothetical protein LQ351_000656 [Letrouitia transgressa]